MKWHEIRNIEPTREKLRLLEDRYEKILREKLGDDHLRELTLQSLRRMINQLTEEIARYEAHVGGRME
jgi:hypothetical protein